METMHGILNVGIIYIYFLFLFERATDRRKGRNRDRDRESPICWFHHQMTPLRFGALMA